MDDSSSLVAFLEPHERCSKRSKECDRLWLTSSSEEGIDSRFPDIEVASCTGSNPIFLASDLKFVVSHDTRASICRVKLKSIQKGTIIVFPPKLIVAHGQFSGLVVQVDGRTHVVDEPLVI